MFYDTVYIVSQKNGTGYFFGKKFYENKKENLQSASGMSGIFRHILWQSKSICRSETGIVGNGDTAETGKRLCRAGRDQKQWGGFFRKGAAGVFRYRQLQRLCI